jgi:hypothetical protein
LSNLNEGVGKKIVEALKKQSEIESGAISSAPQDEPEGLGVDVEALDSIKNNGLLSGFDEDDEPAETTVNDLFSEKFESPMEEKETFNDFMQREEKPADASEMPGNIVVLKKLISQLPSGVTRHTGAQIIRQTMEALGIPMKSVIREAQQVQEALTSRARECQKNIIECKKQINILEAQSPSYQRQVIKICDIINLFVKSKN